MEKESTGNMYITVYIYISIYIRFTPPTQDAIATPKADITFLGSGIPT